MIMAFLYPTTWKIMLDHMRDTQKLKLKPGMPNWLPAGRMRPNCFLNAARSYLLNHKSANNWHILVWKGFWTDKK